MKFSDMVNRIRKDWAQTSNDADPDPFIPGSSDYMGDPYPDESNLTNGRSIKVYTKTVDIGGFSLTYEVVRVINKYDDGSGTDEYRLVQPIMRFNNSYFGTINARDEPEHSCVTSGWWGYRGYDLMVVIPYVNHNDGNISWEKPMYCLDTFDENTPYGAWYDFDRYKIKSDTFEGMVSQYESIYGTD